MKAKITILRIQYPNNWIILQEDDSITGIIDIIKPNRLNNRQILPAKLTVSVEEGIISLDEHKKSAEEAILNFNTNVTIQKNNESFFELEQPRISNRNAYEITYRVVSDDKELKKTHIVTVKNGKAYVLTYQGEHKSYEDNLNAARLIVSTFTLTN